MKKVLYILFIVISTNLFSQVEAELSKSTIKYDTTYIENVSDKLAIRIYNIWKNTELKLTELNTNKYLLIEPNGSTNIGIGFNYKWMGLGVAFGMPFINNDDDVYGKTKRFDFQLNLYGRTMGADIYFQRYKGFFISNPDMLVSWDKKEYPILDEMQIIAAGASVYYFFNNKKFSYRAAFVRNEIQKKGQGSMILGVYYGLNSAFDKTGFLSNELKDSLNTLFDIYSFNSNNFGISFGYTFTFVIAKRFFINLSLVPGLGGVKTRINTSDKVYKLDPHLAVRYIARFALGYEHKNFYLGLTAYSTGSSYKYSYIKIEPSTGNVKLFFGKRF